MMKSTKNKSGKKFFVILVIVWFLLLALLFIYFRYYKNYLNISPSLVIPSPTPSLKQTVLVSRVIDGDTVELSTGERVRYLGIDAKESNSQSDEDNCLAKKALEANRSLVEGKEAVLEKDQSDRDKYDRLLRYVWVDGGLVNQILLEEGMAQVMAIPPDAKYRSEFKSAQIEAQANKQGMWQEDICKI